MKSIIIVLSRSIPFGLCANVHHNFRWFCTMYWPWWTIGWLLLSLTCKKIYAYLKIIYMEKYKSKTREREWRWFLLFSIQHEHCTLNSTCWPHLFCLSYIISISNLNRFNTSWSLINVRVNSQYSNKH